MKHETHLISSCHRLCQSVVDGAYDHTVVELVQMLVITLVVCLPAVCNCHCDNVRGLFICSV